MNKTRIKLAQRLFALQDVLYHKWAQQMNAERRALNLLFWAIPKPSGVLRLLGNGLFHLGMLVDDPCPTCQCSPECQCPKEMVITGCKCAYFCWGHEGPCPCLDGCVCPPRTVVM